MTKIKETGYIKYLTEEEFQLLLKEVKNRESQAFRMCFYCMAYLGLRISDATNLKLDNLNKDCSEMFYLDQKTKVAQHKILPEFLMLQFQAYIKSKGIKDGFLFPPERGSSKPHIQPATFRWFFRDFRCKYGYDKPYHTCTNGKKLYRISPHTLKHYCLWKMYKASGNDIIFVKSFSGHKKMKHTIRYIQHEENRTMQKSIIEKAFAAEIA